ncbi:hypothetical protein [Paenibacillus kobensis]|uniref:hypothetical protein n=1 Tax=Paenibacillus kobensis TaxID=59841 RepID=UPI000FD8FC1B|nr:hypothetical protein [Paenibacillus kobensis]
MHYTIAVIIISFAVLIVAGSRTLIRKGWYRDFILYAVLLGWAGVMMTAVNLNLPYASSMTSIYWLKAGLRLVTPTLRATINWAIG